MNRKNRFIKKEKKILSGVFPFHNKYGYTHKAHQMELVYHFYERQAEFFHQYSESPASERACRYLRVVFLISTHNLSTVTSLLLLTGLETSVSQDDSIIFEKLI